MSVQLKGKLLLLMTLILIILCYELTEKAHVNWHRAFRDTHTRTTQAIIDTPRTNLYFMKTHKTGSTTLQNILTRYAWNNKLIVGLPKSESSFPSYYKGRKFSRDEIQKLPQNASINMIFHHMVFNYKEVTSTLPRSDTIYITLLRDPATLFPSAFYYYHNAVGPFKLAFKDGLGEFLKEPSRYFSGRKCRGSCWHAKNNMFYDMGFDNLNETEGYVQQSIKVINKTFDLVMIAEYFDEGLILLKSIMRWNIKDVAYVSVNARKKATDKNYDVTSIYAWNKADTAIYKFFKKSFLNRVKNYGKGRMEKELNELELWKKRYKHDCLLDDTISNKLVSNTQLKLFNPAGVDLEQYQLRNETKNNETCIGLIRPETKWWERLSQKQRSL